MPLPPGRDAADPVLPYCEAREVLRPYLEEQAIAAIEIRRGIKEIKRAAPGNRGSRAFQKCRRMVESARVSI